MEARVLPVVRAEFVSRDVLFVDVGGEGKRHTRASPTEIQDLLNGKADKDQVGHWYEAQLIHYGLQRSKEKNTAKVRLQKELGKNALSVPPHIVDMEAQMKKEYAAAVRKVKAQTKGEKDLGTPASSAIQKKRKVNEESHGSTKKTKISVTVGDVSFDIEHDTAAAATKKGTTKETTKVKAAPKSATPAKSGGKSAGAKLAAQEAKAKKSESTKAGSKTDSKQPARATPSTSKAKAVTGSATQSASPAKAKAAPEGEQNVKSTKAEPKVKSEPKAKAMPKPEAEPKVQAEPKVKSEPKVKKEPVMTSLKANAIKREPIEDQEDMYLGHSFQEMLETRNVTGLYDLWCPQIAEQLPEEADKLRLFLHVEDEKLWGGFELAMKTGVILAESLASAVDRESVSFGWRARDRWDEGRLKFGKGCFGDIALFGQDQVRATFHNLFPG